MRMDKMITKESCFDLLHCNKIILLTNTIKKTYMEISNKNLYFNIGTKGLTDRCAFTSLAAYRYARAIIK